MAGSRKYSGVKVLDKAFDTLETIGSSERGLSLTEVVSELGIPHATAHRLLHHLTDRGYVEQDPATKRYFLGIQILALRARVIYVWQIATRARPLLRDMMLATTCLSHLAVYRNGEVVYVDRVDTADSVARFIPVGKRVPAHCSALGKTLLAHLPSRTLQDYLSNADLTQLTPYTLTDPDNLQENLFLVRERGYALDLQEMEEGNWCVAAPVRDYSGRTVAAISIATKDPSKAEGLHALASIVTETALRISTELGFRPESDQIDLALGMF
ncbi:MAG: IclR family transcriptional regulator [Anaerolineae bacterium]|nr:IclR family transcriptional regulator [Anaerolineae bacterium]